MIPTEIIQHILRQLDSVADILTCSLVCRGWSYLALEILWYKPSIRPESWLMFFNILQTNTNDYAYFIRRINLSSISSLLQDQHLKTLYYCKRLERLTLANCSNLTDQGVCNLISNINSALISIDLSDVHQVSDLTLFTISQSCPQLQGLNLSMSQTQEKISDQGLFSIAKHCKKLKRVKLNNCINITESSVIELTMQCPYLVELDLMNCQINNMALESIFKHSNELRELRICQLDNVCPLRITKVAFIHLVQYEQLRLVDFTGVYTLTDTTLDILIQAAPKIRSLVLNKCSQITDQGIFSICQLGRYLHFLHLGHCSLLTDRSIIQLANSCNRIRYLDMACCTNITDKSVIEIAKNLSKLKRIGLVKCIYITDISIHALCHHSRMTNSLERIHLSYCARLGVRAITVLLNACRRLNHLSLTNVPAFQRQDLQKFCRTPPKEFTELQRHAFCVYSGKGVQEVRDYLNITSNIYNYQLAVVLE